MSVAYVLGGIIAILVPFLAGQCILRLWELEKNLNPSLMLGLSMPLGWGCISFVIIVLQLLKIKLNFFLINGPLVAFILLCFSYFKNRPSLLQGHVYRDAPRSVRVSILAGTALAYIGVQVIFVIIKNWVFPMHDWDAIWRIAIKAKVIFLDGSFEKVSNLPLAAYPLHLESLLAWMGFNVGAWSEPFIKILFDLIYITSLVLCYGILRMSVDRVWALLGTMLLTSSAFFTFHGAVEYADLLVTLYNLAAIGCLMVWVRFEDRRMLFLTGIFAAIGVWTKLEASAYAVIYIIAAMTFAKQYKKHVFLLSIPVILMGGLYVVLRRMYHLDDAWTHLVFNFNWANVLQRLPVMADAIVKNTLLMNNWHILWFLLLISLFAYYRKGVREKSIELLICLLSLFLLNWIIASLFTQRFDYLAGSHAQETLSRFILHFFPLCPLLITLIAYKDFGSKVH